MKFAPYARAAINPLFWQHAGAHEAIGEEMRRMKESGINEFVVEPRPHPDYLGEGWWRDLDYILDQAEKLDMYIWLFDDRGYPSGSGNGEIAARYPQYKKRYWNEHHMDAHGPMPHAHFMVDAWLEEGEALFCVIAARRTQARGSELDSDTLIDITHLVSHGRVYWPVPEGDWRVFVIKTTPKPSGGYARNHVNPISREAVRKNIEIVHEAHYARYGHLFGSRIKGFFTDEPSFANAEGYDRIIGKSAMPLPYTEGLLNLLGQSPLGDFTRFLPLLWHDDAQGICRDARYNYMDVVSRLFAECFTGQIGDWCRKRGVRLIGHVIEENGAHSRLGYGAGHFFRAMQGMGASGMDNVNNLFPGQTEGSYITVFNNYDCDFNHWGLAKMTSSAAHADPRKENRALSESFGAYGWCEGLRVMKWISDHLIVQGINIITPHAFSPADFPNSDCPPHFYARGMNPQFKHFHVWSNYVNRLLDPLTDAEHIAPVAVVYHAEAEWGGECEPFEKAVKVLSQARIDSDVLSIDTLLASYAEGGILFAGTEKYRALVVPYSQMIPPAFAEKINAFADAGLPVYFTRALPEGRYFGGGANLRGVKVVETANLAGELSGFADIRCDAKTRELLYCHYRKNGVDTYLFVNQSVHDAVDTVIAFRDERSALVYDAMADTSFRAAQEVENGESRIRLQLAPWETKMVVFGCETQELAQWQPEGEYAVCEAFSDGWAISVATAQEYPAFTPVPFTATGDVSRPDRLPDFSGTIRYERTFSLSDVTGLMLDLGEAGESVRVFVNGHTAAEMICPPYRVKLPEDMLFSGENNLVIEVTNTLVKAHSKTPYDCYFVQDPSGLADPVLLKKRI